MANNQTTTHPPAIRREVLAAFAGALCTPAIATVPSRIPAPDPLDVVRHTADLLAGQMAEVHGGAWKATVERDLVLIRLEGGAL